MNLKSLQTTTKWARLIKNKTTFRLFKYDYNGPALDSILHFTKHAILAAAQQGEYNCYVVLDHDEMESAKRVVEELKTRCKGLDISINMAKYPTDENQLVEIKSSWLHSQ